MAAAWARELAERDGPIVMPQWLTPDDIVAERAYYSLEWLVTERSISVNTAAAGVEHIPRPFAVYIYIGNERGTRHAHAQLTYPFKICAAIDVEIEDDHVDWSALARACE